MTPHCKAASIRRCVCPVQWGRSYLECLRRHQQNTARWQKAEEFRHCSGSSRSASGRLQSALRSVQDLLETLENEGRAETELDSRSPGKNFSWKLLILETPPVTPPLQGGSSMSPAIRRQNIRCCTQWDDLLVAKQKPAHAGHYHRERHIYCHSTCSIRRKSYKADSARGLLYYNLSFVCLESSLKYLGHACYPAFFLLSAVGKLQLDLF